VVHFIGGNDRGNKVIESRPTLPSLFALLTHALLVTHASVADSAYGYGGLPLHTDMAYAADPPGLQIFTMVQPAQRGGGASTYADGLAAAFELRAADPAAYRLLSTTVRRFRCIDRQTGWHLEASAPVIRLCENDYVPHSNDSYLQSARVVSIRHNDLDRLPDLPPPGCEEERDVNAFYQDLAHAHAVWDSILASDGLRLEIFLQPGETMIVNNHRCFHGRCSFEVNADDPARMISGCYVSGDELRSRFRQEGFPAL
jgi:alpha-ketoglutarate-dependent taurine dioxygenase